MQRNFRFATEVIRLTIENAIHRKAFETAQYANSEQENLLRRLLAVTFQAAKEGIIQNSFLHIFFVFSLNWGFKVL